MTVYRSAIPILICATVAVASGCRYGAQEAPPHATGYVEATDVRIASKVAGRLATVNVTEGARIEAIASRVPSRLFASLLVQRREFPAPFPFEAEQYRVRQQPLVELQDDGRVEGWIPVPGSSDGCRGRTIHPHGATRALQHPEPVGLGETDVEPQALEVVAQLAARLGQWPNVGH